MSVSLDRLQYRSVFGRSKRNRNAVAHLQAFERVVEALDSERRQWVALMRQTEQAHRFNDPRYERGTAVNATETRVTAPWKGSRHSAADVTVIEGLPYWLTGSLDTETIAAHWPSRVRVVSAAASGTEKPRAGRRQARQVDVRVIRAERLRAAAGTIRMAEQD